MNDAKWREDLPLESAVDEYTTRRDFIKFLVMISGATFLGNGYLVVKSMLKEARPHETLRVAAVDELPVGGVKLFRYPTPDEPAILVRIDETRWAAYSQRCTHLSCPVLYAPERGRLECPCHDGAFDVATGRVLYGPPPRPLPRVILRVADGEIFAEGVAPS